MDTIVNLADRRENNTDNKDVQNIQSLDTAIIRHQRAVLSATIDLISNSMSAIAALKDTPIPAMFDLAESIEMRIDADGMRFELAHARMLEGVLIRELKSRGSL